jgi:hypothetical protein
VAARLRLIERFACLVDRVRKISAQPRDTGAMPRNDAVIGP